MYDPPWGKIAPLELENGRALIPAGYTDSLRRAMNDLAGRRNVRLRFIGYTANDRLDRRTAMVYGDDVGLSAARAKRAMETMSAQMGLEPSQAEHEGRGFVHSDDVVNAGFIRGETSYVRVQVVYDELAPLDDYEGVDITRLTRELKPKNPYELNLMRITVDGEPIDDPARSSSDIQRCTDVALDKANIEFRFDNLESRRRLAVAATPASVEFVDAGEEGDGGIAGALPHVRKLRALHRAIGGAHLRHGQSVQSSPLQVLEIDRAGSRRVAAVGGAVPGAGSRAPVRAACLRRQGQLRRDQPEAALDGLPRCNRAGSRGRSRFGGAVDGDRSAWSRPSSRRRPIRSEPAESAQEECRSRTRPVRRRRP